MIKKLTAAAIAAFIALSVCGCEKQQPAEPVQKNIIEYQAATEIAEGRKNIYLIVKNLTSSYWQVIIDGVTAGGIDYGYNIYYSGSENEMDWDVQSQLMDIAVSRGADAIIFAPDDSIMLSPKVSEVHSSGMPVILVDTVVNTDEYDICYMTDNLRAGQNAAEEMLRRFEYAGINENDEAYVAIQIGGRSSQTINERLAGFCQYWTKHAPYKWKIVDDVKSNEGDVSRAEQCAAEFLDGGLNIRGVFGCNNGSTVGFAREIKNRGRTDIAVVGFDYSDEMKELILDESYNASTMLQRQYMMGYYAVGSVQDVLDGKDIPIKFVDTGIATVNYDNINDPEIQEIISHN